MATKKKLNVKRQVDTLTLVAKELSTNRDTVKQLREIMSNPDSRRVMDEYLALLREKANSSPGVVSAPPTPIRSYSPLLSRPPSRADSECLLPSQVVTPVDRKSVV